MGKEYHDVANGFIEKGYTDVKLSRKTEASLFTRAGTVTEVTVNGKASFMEGDWTGLDDPVCIAYYEPLSEDEIKAMHPGEIRMPHSYRHYLGRKDETVAGEMWELGFRNISVDKLPDLTKEDDRKLHTVSMITADGKKFNIGDWIPEEAEIYIIYHEVVWG